MTLIIADDHPLFRSALKEAVKRYFAAEIIESSSLETLQQAVAAARDGVHEGPALPRGAPAARGRACGTARRPGGDQRAGAGARDRARPEGPGRARALGLARALFESTRDPEVGQTYAMALAETGSFEQAVVLQRE